MEKAITEFKGKYFFLSNFYETPVTYKGIKFNSNEAAFQAFKCPERAEEFTGLNPSEAKRLGRKVALRADWETVKFYIMYEVCLAKFLQNKDLCEKLLQTGDRGLVEGNTWGDRTWGVCGGFGENHLGRILMQIRGEIERHRRLGNIKTA